MAQDKAHPPLSWHMDSPHQESGKVLLGFPISFFLSGPLAFGLKARAPCLFIFWC